MASYAARTVLLFFCASLSLATPQISLPVNSQVPPLAIISEPFSFTFSESTFFSDSGSLRYSLDGGPKWLQLDGGSRTFSGTPSNSDGGSNSFTLNAADDNGNASMPVTFIVTSETQPSISKPLEDQLPDNGNASAPTTLSLYPETSFSIKLDPDTFGNEGSTLNYYAISPNNTPLPSWVQFDGHSLTFSGKSPPLSALNVQPETFGVKLIASRVLGFAGTETVFNLTVGAHQLAFDKSEITSRISEGTQLDVRNLKNQLKLDNRNIKSDEIQSVKANKPDWVKLDTSSISLSGKVPAGVRTQNVTITAQDTYGDVASILVMLQRDAGLFSKSIGTLDATPGKAFSYDLGSSIAPNRGVKLSVNLGTASQWLKYNSKTLTLQGTVPKHLKPGDIQIKITATSSSGGSSDSQTAAIRVQEPSSANAKPNSSTAPTTSSSAASDAAQTGGAAPARAGPSKATIALAIVIPIAVLFLAGLLIFCCCRRKRKIREASRTSTPVPDEGESMAEVEELWPEALPVSNRAPDSPKRLPALNAILKEGLGLRFSSSQPRTSMDREDTAWSTIRDSRFDGPESEFAHGALSMSPRSKASTLRFSGLQKSPRQRVSHANQLLATYSEEWTDESGSTAHYRSSGSRSPSIPGLPEEDEDEEQDEEDDDDDDEEEVEGSTIGDYHGRSTPMTLRSSSMAPGSSNASTAYAASSSFRPHVPPRSKTGRNPSVSARSQDTDRNRYLRQIRGKSPFFAGSARTSFTSRRSLSHRAWASQLDSPTLPRNHPLIYERPTTLSPAVVRESSRHTIPEHETSPTPSNHHLSNVFSSTTADQTSSRFMSSRLSSRFSRLGRQMSNVSSRLYSTTSSPRSRYGARFDEMSRDENDDFRPRRRRRHPSLPTGSSSGYWTRDSRGDLLEYGDHSEVETGMAMTGRPHLHRGRASVAASRSGIPKLVEFKAKRPVSVDSGTPNRRHRESSRSGSYAFI